MTRGTGNKPSMIMYCALSAINSCRPTLKYQRDRTWLQPARPGRLLSTGGKPLRVKLIVRKEGTALYENIHEIVDAESFGRAFTRVWTQLQNEKLQETTSIGELMEVMNNDLIETLDGTEIQFEMI
jgi:hypothetical protein